MESARRVARVGGAVVRRHRGDFLIVLFMSILMLLGLVVIYSISPALTARINAAGNTLDQNHFMYRQVAYLGVGVLAFVAASLVPIDWWKKYQNKLLIAGLILCLVPIVASGTALSLCTNGACRWINLGFVTLQPAEIVKFALLIFLAGFLAKRIGEGKLNNPNETLWPLAIIMGAISLVVVVLQKDLGTGIAIFGIAVTMLYVAGLNKKYFGMALLGIAGLGLLFTITSPHRLERVATFFGGHAQDAADTGYHINQALIAVGSGGLTGKGLGRSIQAFGYLPEAANDSIFAIFAEKFGFLGTLAVLAIFAALFLRLLKVMDNAGTPYHKLLVAGVFGWIFTHTVVNVGAMLGIFPLTGITLPFLSFGGTSLLFIMGALGLALNASRYTVHNKPNSQNEGGGADEDRRSRRGVGRTRYAGTSRTTNP
ncbi:MAG TPA: putative peptidoglycan glycosyltransferase FtsW [Candidatus Saccharimonadales bacterium]|nr:putative peptidoglycan glycosyltransferase FtsW [Candidatus Saccharimonadales bacterium]